MTSGLPCRAVVSQEATENQISKLLNQTAQAEIQRDNIISRQNKLQLKQHCTTRLNLRSVRSGYWDQTRSSVMLCKQINKYRSCVKVYNRCLIQLYSQVGETML